MRAICGFLAVALLAGCGVDGPPEPVPPKAKPGVSLAGTVSVGVTGSF